MANQFPDWPQPKATVQPGRFCASQREYLRSVNEKRGFVFDREEYNQYTGEYTLYWNYPPGTRPR